MLAIRKNDWHLTLADPAEGTVWTVCGLYVPIDEHETGEWADVPEGEACGKCAGGPFARATG